MAGRRGARSGRGWDALPPRAGRRQTDEHPSGGPPGDGAERGNVPARRRWGPPDGPPDGSTGGGRGREPGAGREPAAGRARPPQDEAELAREICLRQLAVRPRTRAELAKALHRKEISDEVIAEVLDRYDEVGIIDDAAFARAWVSSRHHGRGLARRALADELRRRGVAAEVASEALETVDEDDEAATARSLVDRKLRTATGTPEAVFRRLVGMLARKGYPAGVAIRAVKDALAARDAEAAEFADRIDADALAEEAPDT
jgi:regulatory protein